MNSDILLVYYSLTSKTHEIARLIRRAEGCDMDRIEVYEEYADIPFGLKQRLLHEGDSYRPKIRELSHDIREYGTVILGMPVWNNDIPAPMLTFIESVDWRGIRVLPFFSSGGAFMNIYSSLKQRCKGASLADPLYLIYDDCGNFLKIIE